MPPTGSTLGASMRRPADAPANAPCVVAPERVEGPGRLDRSHYRCVYRLRGEAGQVLVQRVAVRVRWFVGDQLVAIYRGRYHEWFRCRRDGASVLDHHDFLVHRDRWTVPDVQRLLRTHAPTRSLPRGDVRLEVLKSFQLGLGVVAEEQAVPIDDGFEFGIAASGDGEPTHARLTVTAADGFAGTAVPGIEAAPGGVVVAGRADFRSPPRWRATEHFRYHFACLVGSFRDRAGYIETTPRPAAARCAR
jgi:hypothetical protein